MPINPRDILKGSVLCFEGQAVLVKAVSEFIMFEGRKEWIGGSLINGEPLSEVWLDRLGLSKIQEGSMSHPAIFRKTYIHRLVESAFEIQSRGEFFWIEGNTIVEIEHVHQVQLLFFAITREHLTVPKLKPIK